MTNTDDEMDVTHFGHMEVCGYLRRYVYVSQAYVTRKMARQSESQ